MEHNTIDLLLLMLLYTHVMARSSTQQANEYIAHLKGYSTAAKTTET